MRKTLIVLAAAAGFAVPAVAFASHGADDATETGTTTTTTTTTAPATPTTAPITAEQKRRAVAAAKARVGGGTLVRIERASSRGAYDVRLNKAGVRYDVRVSAAFDVTRVRRHASKSEHEDRGGDDHGSGGHGSDD